MNLDEGDVVRRFIAEVTPEASGTLNPTSEEVCLSRCKLKRHARLSAGNTHRSEAGRWIVRRTRTRCAARRYRSLADVNFQSPKVTDEQSIPLAVGTR